MQTFRKKSGYLPSLDGWRAIAVLGVLMTHDLPWTLVGFSNAGWKGLGGIGVNLFFAISGILITTRILQDEALGRFRLKDFYVRRLFRIQPAALMYLAVVAVLILGSVIHERWHFWAGALLLYANFLHRASDTTGSTAAFFTGHFWTLSVEEHFYILLSALLLCFRKRRVEVFAVLVAGLLAWHRYGARHGIYDAAVSSRRTYWVLEYLMLPSLLALLLQKPAVRLLCDRYLHPWVAYGITAALMLTDFSRAHGFPTSVVSLLGAESTLLSFGFSLWVIATMLHPRSLSTRVLEWKPLRWVGRISYSLYLWHVLFFVSVFPGSEVSSPVLLFLSSRPWKYVAALGAAVLSYYLIERPLIRMGHRLAPPATPGHRDLEESREAVPVS